MNLVPFAIGLLKGNWKLILGVGLALALIVQTFRLQATEGALSASEAGRAADRSSYERAQAQATANALQAKIEREAQDAKKADAADARADDLAAKYRAIVLRYADAQRAASASHLPQPTESTASGNGPGGPAVIPQGSILIPQDDALICADNTARLEAVRGWALGL